MKLYQYMPLIILPSFIFQAEADTNKGSSSSSSGVESQLSSQAQDDAKNAAPSSSADAETAKVHQIVEKFLKDNPKVVVEALQAYGEQQQKAQQIAMNKLLTDNKAKLLDQKSAVVYGDPSAAKKFVVFVDPNCPHCRHFEATIHKELDKNDKVATFLVRYWPILGEDSRKASSYLIAASTNDKSRAFSKAVADAKEKATEESLLKIATANKIDVNSLKTNAISAGVTEQINANDTLAKALQIQGTPTVVSIAADGTPSIANLTNLDKLDDLLSGKDSSTESESKAE